MFRSNTLEERIETLEKKIDEENKKIEIEREKLSKLRKLIKNENLSSKIENKPKVDESELKITTIRKTKDTLQQEKDKLQQEKDNLHRENIKKLKEEYLKATQEHESSRRTSERAKTLRNAEPMQSLESLNETTNKERISEQLRIADEYKKEREAYEQLKLESQQITASILAEKSVKTPKVAPKEPAVEIKKPSPKEERKELERKEKILSDMALVLGSKNASKLDAAIMTYLVAGADKKLKELCTNEKRVEEAVIKINQLLVIPEIGTHQDIQKNIDSLFVMLAEINQSIQDLNRFCTSIRNSIFTAITDSKLTGVLKCDDPNAMEKLLDSQILLSKEDPIANTLLFIQRELFTIETAGSSNTGFIINIYRALSQILDELSKTSTQSNALFNSPKKLNKYSALKPAIKQYLSTSKEMQEAKAQLAEAKSPRQNK